jgi:hypothetical protein
MAVGQLAAAIGNQVPPALPFHRHTPTPPADAFHAIRGDAMKLRGLGSRFWSRFAVAAAYATVRLPGPSTAIQDDEPWLSLGNQAP